MEERRRFLLIGIESIKMKRKILFLCGHYAFPTAANSICVQNLAEEFQRDGHQVFVLAKGCEYSGEKEDINGVTVWKYFGDSYSKVVAFFYQRKNLFWKTLFSVIQIIRYLFVVFFLSCYVTERCSANIQTS